MLSEQNKRDFCALLLQQYGLQINIDNELLPVFYLAYRSAQVTEKTCLTTKENVEQIITDFNKDTAAKISKLEMKQFQFSDTKAAFWFAFGRFGVSVVVISILVFSGWVWHSITERKKQDIAQISYLLEKSPVQDKILNDSIATRIITLFPAKDLQHAVAGKNYVYKEECACIEIPLHYQQRLPK
jgi:hypothetical protein